MAFQALNDKLIVEIPEEALGHSFIDPLTNETKYIKYPNPKLEGLKVPLKIVSVGENVPPSLQVGDKIFCFKEHVTLITVEDVQYIMLQWFDVEIKITD